MQHHSALMPALALMQALAERIQSGWRTLLAAADVGLTESRGLTDHKHANLT